MKHPVILLFGATGDLAQRMLWPSLFHLHCDGLLPPELHMLGTSRSDLSTEQFRAELATVLRRFAHAEDVSDANIAAFLVRVDYLALDVGNAAEFDRLAARLGELGAQDVLCYLSTSPALYTTICSNLQAAGLANERMRLILEKPIGHDLASSRKISDAVCAIFAEERIYRVDHYLGKETVQNLLALRFANSLFEPVWNAGAIEQRADHHRRDRRHRRPLVVLRRCRRPARHGAEPHAAAAGPGRDGTAGDTWRRCATKRSRCCRACVRSTPATCAGKPWPGSMSPAGMTAPRVSRATSTKTAPSPAAPPKPIVAISAFIDNWRWKGVPFFLRTGKRLASAHTEIVVQFREVPHNIFPGAENAAAPNRLVIRLQPEETITLELMNKQPGPVRRAAATGGAEPVAGRGLRQGAPAHRLRAPAARRAERQLAPCSCVATNSRPRGPGSTVSTAAGCRRACGRCLIRPAATVPKTHVACLAPRAQFAMSENAAPVLA